MVPRETAASIGFLRGGMTGDPVVIVGAGIGGLACAINLAGRGLSVTVVERAKTAGGKMREVAVGGTRMDAGPTVFTMRWVFDELFESAGATLTDYLSLTPLQTLARHAWSENERFDLFSDVVRSADAVAAFSGPAEGRRFLAFCAEAREMYNILKKPFLSSPRPNPLTLANRIGFGRFSALFAIRPFETMWSALSAHFSDPRLRQLFGRYATYSGSSPYAAPATLMLIAHVEQEGVWVIDGGMQRLAEALERLARTKGVAFRFGEEVSRVTVRNGVARGVTLSSGEYIESDAVVLNADAAALSEGLFGMGAIAAVPPLRKSDRSLSAVTWALSAQVEGFEPLRHNVFFSPDYLSEFDDIFRRRTLPRTPTIYVCAQDRVENRPRPGIERLMILVNAPAVGDETSFSAKEIATCETQIFNRLERCGLSVLAREAIITTPQDFHRLFPGTGGALYGRSSHGWRASFLRPTSKTKIANLYLAGGSTHPGAGVPMAALSGRLAAQQLVSDRASMRSSRRAAIYGGMSTQSATMDVLQSR